MFPPWAPFFAARRRRGLSSLPAGKAGLRRLIALALDAAWAEPSTSLKGV
jgi:hypothetical protein